MKWDRALELTTLTVGAAGIWLVALLGTAILRATLAIPSSQAVTRQEVRRHLRRMTPEGAPDEPPAEARPRTLADIMRASMPPPPPDIDPTTGGIRVPDVRQHAGVFTPETDWAEAEAQRRRAELEESDLDRPALG